jgi:mono/diheme cytochrome c family protein
MAERTPRNRIPWVLAGLGLLASSTAVAFPWDIDMVDAYFYRGYEWAMMQLPDGVVSRDLYVANADRMTPEGQALQNPFGEPNSATLQKGERMFTVYCATCHGVEGKGGAEVMRNDPTLGINRYPVPAPMLSGTGNVTSMRTDGYIYLTIRNGAAVMPGYNQAMYDHEMWSVVSYIRTLEGAAYLSPTPPTAGE